jgi:hypothetical protein
MRRSRSHNLYHKTYFVLRFSLCGTNPHETAKNYSPLVKCTVYSTKTMEHNPTRSCGIPPPLTYLMGCLNMAHHRMILLRLVFHQWMLPYPPPWDPHNDTFTPHRHTYLPPTSHYLGLAPHIALPSSPLSPSIMSQSLKVPQIKNNPPHYLSTASYPRLFQEQLMASSSSSIVPFARHPQEDIAPLSLISDASRETSA